MANQDITEVVEIFLRKNISPFKVEDFRKFLKLNKVKISVENIKNILYTADNVFGIVNDYFITRAGAFTGQWFSFKPTKEEVEKRAFIPGHRFMPFYDNSSYPYYAKIMLACDNSKELVSVPKTKIDLDTNTVLDLHALFGEGYIIPYVLNDPAGDGINLSSVQYGLPQTLPMSAFSLEPYFAQGFKYGDRILCRVTDWAEQVIETKIKKCNPISFKMSEDDLEREDWYTKFENAVLNKIEKCGPARTIEEQLALLFLEEQKELCIENCGSCSEFLEHTTKIGFVPYGIESRIWRLGEEIPFIGKWNQDAFYQSTMPDLAFLFADYVTDSYIKSYLFKHENKADKESIEELAKEVFPESLSMNEFEHNFALLHIEKRTDMIKKSYSRFTDFPLAELRRDVLSLFSRITVLMSDIGSSNTDLKKFPQAELITLSQLTGHVAQLLEEIEFESAHAVEEKDDLHTSLEGMYETFEGIEIPLQQAIKTSGKKNFFIQ